MHCQELQTIHYPEMVTNMKGIGDQKNPLLARTAAWMRPITITIEFFFAISDLSPGHGS